MKEKQKVILRHLIEGNDVFGVLPTGFGKSMTYILYPLILDQLEPDRKHTALVISPLKAFMLDQVSYLEGQNIQSAALIEETLVKDIVEQDLSILFACPEAATQQRWRKLLKDRFKDKVCLLVFDEAHCISSRGLDFRPTCRQVSILQSLFEVPNLVLTATATTKIQTNICELLGLQDEKTKVVAELPNRPTIFLDIRQSTEKFENELEWLLQHLKSATKKMIVYVRSINLCYQIYLYIVTNLMEKAFVSNEVSISNRKLEMFHANTDTESKNRILEEFSKTESNIKVLISTVAFGMGVNIRDIDLVIHWGLPTSPLSYWQEVGRCSRDGRRGYAVCYAYKRSYCKLKDDDDFRKVTSLDNCIRATILKNFELQGMNTSNALQKTFCDNECEGQCECSYCLCCAICWKQCACKTRAKEPLTAFLTD